MKRNKPKRIDLSPAAEEKLQNLIYEITSKGICKKVSLSKMANLLLEAKCEDVSPKLRKKIEEKLFDPFTAIHLATQALHGKAKSGEEVNLDAFLALLPNKTRPYRRSLSKPSSKSTSV